MLIVFYCYLCIDIFIIFIIIIIIIMIIMIITCKRRPLAGLVPREAEDPGGVLGDSKDTG